MGDDVLDAPPPSPGEIHQAWDRFRSAAEKVLAKAPPPYNQLIRVAPNTTATAAVVLPGDDQRTGNGVSVRDYAKLAKACYDPKWNDPSSWTAPPGWTCVTANPDSVVGYASAEYVDANGNYVCAFRGTDEGIDWKANLLQGMQLPTAQYDLAYGLARHLALRFQQGILFTDSACTTKATSLTFTGHSLGGGLAGSAWTLTGYPTVTFNAAGVSLMNRLLDNLQAGNDENQDGDGATVEVQNRGGPCTNYHVYREILSTGQWAMSAQWLAEIEPHLRELEEKVRPGLLAHAAGHQIMLQRPGHPSPSDPPTNDPVELHLMTTVVPALELPAYPDDHGYL